MKVLFISLILVLVLISSGYSQSEALSLNDCIDMALKNNPTIVRTINQDESADEDVLASYSGILPVISSIGQLGTGGSRRERYRG